jgi:hypothetical protein
MIWNHIIELKAMAMKNFIWALLSVFALLSCSKEDVRPLTALLGQEIKLKEGQTAIYNISQAESSQVLQLKLENVKDRRCPSDAVCVAYGNVEAVLKLSSGDGTGETVTMCLGDCEGGGRSKDTREVTVNSSTYRIILFEITPLPTHKKKSDKVKEAKLLVERI